MLLSTHSRLLRPRERRSMPVYVQVCAQNARPSPYVHICVCVFANLVGSLLFDLVCLASRHVCPCMPMFVQVCAQKSVTNCMSMCVCVCVLLSNLPPIVGSLFDWLRVRLFVWKKFELCFEKMQKFQSLYIAKKFEPNYARKIWNFSKSTCTNRVANGNQSHTHNGHPLVNARQIDFHWPN